MKFKYLKSSKFNMLVSFTLILSFLLSSITLICVEAAGAPPDITVKLNGIEVAYDQNVTVKDRDKLELIADFKSMNTGDVYEVELPGIFLTLNEETIREANKDILQYINLTIVRDPVTKKQTIKIEFLDKVDAASFAFWAVLNIKKEDLDEKHEIVIDSDMSISILPSEPEQPSGEYVGPQWPPSKVPDNDKDLKKGVRSQVTEKQFLEDEDISNALYYDIGLNLSQLDRTLSGTIKDNLPTGMKLFIPSAPDCGKDSYEYAFMSFSICFRESRIKGTDDNNCHIDISDISGAAAKYVGYVNAIEISQGRAGNYTISDLSPTIKIPPYVAENIKTADGKYVTYDGIALGYRIDTGGVIHTTTLDKNHDTLYEQKHIGAWQNDSLYVPMYNTPDCETSIYYEYGVYTQVTMQSVGNGNDSTYREYLGATVEGTETSHKWSYSYNGTEEFILVVTNDSLTDSDSFEVQMKGTKDSFSFGKAFQIFPRVYFDKTKWEVPSDGEILFKNTVTYDYWEKSADTKYIYDFGSSGTVIAGAGKTVDGDKINHINPDGDSTVQKYELTFKKVGNETIPIGNFEVFDRLDNNLAFVTKSLKIFKENAPDTWSDITDVTKNTDTSATTTTVDDINLKAYYDITSHKIIIVNIEKMSFTGKIKVEFKAELARDVSYGTKIPNFFGETVETFVDHKLSINKVDSKGVPIKSNSVTFSIQYTTDNDFEKGTLHNLTDTFGNMFNSLSTDAMGIAEALYKIDDDSFYIKIQEEKAPDGYIKQLEPIWIKAERDSVTQKMNYSLAKKLNGVAISVDAKGLVTLKVENTKELSVNPKPTEISLKAHKVTEGKKLTKGQFEFAVYQGKTLVARGTNAKSGEIIFAPISYTTSGKYRYTIKEISKERENWEMDKREFAVKVTVSENDNGALMAKAVYPSDEVIFVNKYVPPNNIDAPFINDSDAPKTSDGSNVALAIWIASLSLGSILVLIKMKKKYKKLGE